MGYGRATTDSLQIKRKKHSLLVMDLVVAQMLNHKKDYKW